MGHRYSHFQPLTLRLVKRCMNLGYARHKIACYVSYIVNKSRVITLHLLGTAKYKTSGSHLHMLVNIFVKFYDSGSNTFGDMQHTRFYMRDTRMHAL